MDLPKALLAAASGYLLGSISFARLIILIFVIATIPEMRTFARYRREGKLDAYMQGLRESSPRCLLPT